MKGFTTCLWFDNQAEEAGGDRRVLCQAVGRRAYQGKDSLTGASR